MKLPQDKTLTVQGLVSIVGFLAFASVAIAGLIYRNPETVTVAISGIIAIYAHWTQSPAQQSTITALVQQLTPVITALLAQQPVSDATQHLKAVTLPVKDSGQ